MHKFLLPFVLTSVAVLSTLPSLAAAPAWQFNDQQNQLDLQLDTPVQVQARLINHPTRLVIDLPGLQLGRPAFTAALKNPRFRSLRFGQVESNMARVVVDLAPGYTIDPQQVQLKPISGRHWTVDLPEPMLIEPGVNEPADEVAIAVPILPPAELVPPQPLKPQLPKPLLPNILRKQHDRPLVVIDPGHGGPDVGAIGIDGIREKDIVFDISQKLAERLRSEGLDVIMTRDADIDLDLEPRVALAERVKADFFVSVHANSINMSHPEISGLQTYYYHNNSVALAEKIHAQVLHTTGIFDRHIRTARFYVIRNTSMPSVLVEVGFVTGSEDAPHLADPSYRTQTAEAIAAGVLAAAGRQIEQK